MFGLVNAQLVDPYNPVGTVTVHVSCPLDAREMCLSLHNPLSAACAPVAFFNRLLISALTPRSLSVDCIHPRCRNSFTNGSVCSPALTNSSISSLGFQSVVPLVILITLVFPGFPVSGSVCDIVHHIGDVLENPMRRSWTSQKTIIDPLYI